MASVAPSPAAGLETGVGIAPAAAAAVPKSLDKGAEEGTDRGAAPVPVASIEEQLAVGIAPAAAAAVPKSLDKGAEEGTDRGAAPVPVASIEEQLAVATSLDARLAVHRCSDSSGAKFASLASMWAGVLGRLGISGWYSAGAEYWQADAVPATLDGVLGGYAHVSGPDAAASIRFIGALRSSHAEFGRRAAVDCGSGIGRVAKTVLCPLFDSVDLVEQSPRLLGAAREAGAARGDGRYLCTGLQAFAPEAGRYDLVWIQWVVGHLTDADLISCLARCASALRPGGFVCVKENVVRGEAACMDIADTSVTRSGDYLECVFAAAGLEVVDVEAQREWPPDLYPVNMYALRPVAPAAGATRRGGKGARGGRRR